jgi:hypothetical protein
MFTRALAGGDAQLSHHRLLERVAQLVEAGKIRSTATTELRPINARRLLQAHRLVETGRTTPIAPVAITTPVSMSATYSDPGSNDTHTAVVDWGDATTSTPAASGGSLSASHTYGAAGIYTICVTVTDDDGGADTECAENYVVVFDPGAGFVTGGGWISAAPGSFPADPSASGPGRFGFVSKYKKGGQRPGREHRVPVPVR